MKVIWGLQNTNQFQFKFFKREGQLQEPFFYNGGIKDTKKITTESGFEIEGTANHRIKVLDSDYQIVWRYLSDIKAGDIACLNRKRGLFSEDYVNLKEFKKDLSIKDKLPDFLDEKWAEMLGVLVGDGSWCQEKAISVTFGCESFRDFIIPRMVELFGKVFYLNLTEEVELLAITKKLGLFYTTWVGG